MAHSKRLLLLLISGMLIAAPATAAEIKVLDANALTLAMKAIAADFTKETGHQVNFTGVSPGQVEQRLKAGEVYDLVITATDSAAAFERDGKWRPGTRHPLVRVGIGLAVREGVKLDLTTVESTRKALLDAKAITYSDSRTGGLSGPNSQKVLVNLGIADAVKSKTKLDARGQELIADGEVDIGLFQCQRDPARQGCGACRPGACRGAGLHQLRLGDPGYQRDTRTGTGAARLLQARSLAASMGQGGARAVTGIIRNNRCRPRLRGDDNEYVFTGSIRLLKFQHELVHRPGRTVDVEVARVLGMPEKVTVIHELEAGGLDFAA